MLEDAQENSRTQGDATQSWLRFATWKGKSYILATSSTTAYQAYNFWF